MPAERQRIVEAGKGAGEDRAGERDAEGQHQPLRGGVEVAALPGEQRAERHDGTAAARPAG